MFTERNKKECVNVTIFVCASVEEKDKEQNYAVCDHLKRLYLKNANHDTKLFNAILCRERTHAPNVGK